MVMIMQYSCFKIVHFFETLGCLSSVGPKILAVGNYSSEKFQLILDCFDFKLKYGNSENIETDCVDTVVFKLCEIRQRKIFLSTQYI